MTDLKMFKPRESARIRGLEIRQIPKVGDILPYVDRRSKETAYAVPCNARVYEVYRYGVGVEYKTADVTMHGFLCWADIAMLQNHITIEEEDINERDDG